MKPKPRAFHTMLQAAMTHVLGEVAWVRKAYPPGLLAKPSGTSVGALTVRNSITKGGFAELRRHGYPLTGEFSISKAR